MLPGVKVLIYAKYCDSRSLTISLLCNMKKALSETCILPLLSCCDLVQEIQNGTWKTPCGWKETKLPGLGVLEGTCTYRSIFLLLEGQRRNRVWDVSVYEVMEWMPPLRQGRGAWGWYFSDPCQSNLFLWASDQPLNCSNYQRCSHVFSADSRGTLLQASNQVCLLLIDKVWTGIYRQQIRALLGPGRDMFIHYPEMISGNRGNEEKNVSGTLVKYD